VRVAAIPPVLVLGWFTLVPAVGAHGAPAAPRSEAIQIRFGWFWPAGGGELWDTNEQVFTLEASDLDGFTLGLGYLHSIGNVAEIGAGVEFYEETALSRYADFVDESGFGIYHDTELSLVPVTLDVRFLPGGRHRIRPGGRHVLKPVFYVGGGIGATFWEYAEAGDFLDFGAEPPVVFPGRFEDDGVAFEVHGVAGVELPLNPAVGFLIEARYSAADDELEDDFAGLGDIELGGASISGGFSFRF